MVVGAPQRVMTMRIVRPSLAPLALIVVTLFAIAACAGAASIGAPETRDAIGGGDARAQVQDEAAAASGAPSITSGGVGAVIDDARIIRTGTIDLQVTDVARALVTARDGIRAMGGYVGASETSNDGDTPIASITYRIPSARWEEALDLLRGLNGLTAKVINERTAAVEVTGQVIDLEARIRNLRASETALQGIAAGAVKVSDVLEVQAQLTSVRGQIEQLSAQLGDLEDRASFATLTASFSVPVVAFEVASRGFEPGVVANEAAASLVDILQALTTAGIWFAIVWLPILLGLAIILAAGAWVVRRLGFARRPRAGDLPLAG